MPGTIAQNYKLDNINISNAFSHISGQRLKINVWTDVVSSEASVFNLLTSSPGLSSIWNPTILSCVQAVLLMRKPFTFQCYSSYVLLDSWWLRLYPRENFCFTQFILQLHLILALLIIDLLLKVLSERLC